MTDLRSELLDLYGLFPFQEHPLWVGVRRRELTFDQIILAEVQHWLRSRAGRPLRREALGTAKRMSPKIFDLLLETYLEECTHDASGPSHLDLVERLVTLGGYPESELQSAIPTPGNAAAIALYRDIGARGAGCHMLGAGAVEYYYCQLAPQIYDAYTQGYGMTDAQAETYRIHGPMDASHAERAFAILDEAVALHGRTAVVASVRDAFVATSLHYDGMLHAATGRVSYWNGAGA